MLRRAMEVMLWFYEHGELIFDLMDEKAEEEYEDY